MHFNCKEAILLVRDWDRRPAERGLMDPLGAEDVKLAVGLKI